MRLWRNCFHLWAEWPIRLGRVWTSCLETTWSSRQNCAWQHDWVGKCPPKSPQRLQCFPTLSNVLQMKTCAWGIEIPHYSILRLMRLIAMITAMTGWNRAAGLCITADRSPSPVVEVPRNTNFHRLRASENVHEEVSWAMSKFCVNFSENLAQFSSQSLWISIQCDVNLA